MPNLESKNSFQNLDDKNTWLGVVLSLAFIFVFWQFEIEPYLRAQAQATAGQQGATAPAAVAPDGASTTTAPTQIVGATGIEAQALAVSPAHPDSEHIAAAPVITVTSDRFIANISTLGGRLLHFYLKGYTVSQGGEDLVDLVHVTPDGALPGGLYLSTSATGSDDAFVHYHVEGSESPAQISHTLSGDETFSLPLVGSLSDGSTIKKTFQFSGQSYLFNLAAVVEGASAKQPLWLEWTRYFSSADSNQRLNLVGFKSFSKEGKVETIYTAKAVVGVSPVTDNQWISIEDKYFMASLVPSNDGPNSFVIHNAPPDGGHLLSTRAGGAIGQNNFSIYLGPKDSTVLQTVGYQLYRNIDLGFWSFLAFPLLWLLKFYHSLIGNYGLSIILLTLTIKTLFLPLTLKSFKSARAMQAIQPEIKALRERITDPTVLNQEMLGLYKKRGVNPVGGCLPVLVQIPVFFGLYSLLFNAIELRHAPFALWINDLSAPEHLTIFGISVQLMALIWGASMLLQQIMMPAPGIDPSQRKMMLAMPAVFTISILYYPLPAGLLLYYIVNNSITITQQSSIRAKKNESLDEPQKESSPFKATLIAAIVLLSFGYALTLIH